MADYAIFLNLKGSSVVIVGGGAVALRKAQALSAAGASLVIVGEHIEDGLTALCQDSDVKLIRSAYSRDYISGAALVIAATSDHKLNRRIYEDCQVLGLLCNVVDEPELCDFFVPAVLNRGDLQIAIGTGGACPAYAGYLRKKLEQMFTDRDGDFLAELKVIRRRIIEQVSNPAQRKVLLNRLVDDKSFEYFIQNGSVQFQAYAAGLIESIDDT